MSAGALVERDENEVREDFTPSEAVAIGRLIEVEHRKKIAEQESARKSMGPKTPVNDRGAEPAGETREVVGAAVGMSGTTYRKARSVIEAAGSDPQKFGDLARVYSRAAFDRNGLLEVANG